MAKDNNKKLIRDNLGIKRLLILTWGHLNSARKRQVISLLILTFLNSFTELISISILIPYLTAISNPNAIKEQTLIINFLNLFRINNDSDLVLALTIIFAVTVLISAYIRYIYNLNAFKISALIGSDLSINLYKYSLYRPYIYHLEKNSNSIITAISKDINEIIYYVIYPIFNLTSSIIISLSLITALFIMNTSVTLITIILVITLYTIFFKNTSIRIKKISQNNVFNSEILVKIVQETLGSIREIIISNNQRFYIKKYIIEDRELRQDVAFGNFLTLVPKLIIEPLGIIIIGFIGYFFLKTGNSKDVIPFLGTLCFCAIKILPYSQRIYEGITLPRIAKARLSKFLKLLENPPTILDNKSKLKILEFNDKIELKDICFHYSKNSTPVIKNTNLIINRGEKIGIIGKTGSGKSTLFGIIMGILKPTSGNLLFDKKNIFNNRYNHFIKSWQNTFTYVPQDIFLLDGSIAENIAFGTDYKDIDFERMDHAVRKAQLIDFIKNSIDGYRTFIGERGIRLSGGQKQRIAIARAFYKDSKIIFLDEATSALDTNTENLIMQEFNNLGSDITLIIIAHRQNTLKDCDTIYEIKSGKLIKKNSSI